jgi:hypothetical protein
VGDKEEGITHCGPLGSWFSILSWLSLLALEKMEREREHCGNEEMSKRVLRVGVGMNENASET